MISNNFRGDEELADVWASRLQRWGVAGVFPLAATLLRPFAFLGAQAVHLLAPVLTTFSSPTEIERLADLLESPAALDRLSDRLSSTDQD
jgi:hypothetical protein